MATSKNVISFVLRFLLRAVPASPRLGCPPTAARQTPAPGRLMSVLERHPHAFFPAIKRKLPLHALGREVKNGRNCSLLPLLGQSVLTADTQTVRRAKPGRCIGSQYPFQWPPCTHAPSPSAEATERIYSFDWNWHSGLSFSFLYVAYNIGDLPNPRPAWSSFDRPPVGSHTGTVIIRAPNQTYRAKTRSRALNVLAPILPPQEWTVNV